MFQTVFEHVNVGVYLSICERTCVCLSMCVTSKEGETECVMCLCVCMRVSTRVNPVVNRRIRGMDEKMGERERENR